MTGAERRSQRHGLRTLLRANYATCNNEPFMLTVYDMSLEEIYVDCGFQRDLTFTAFVPGLFIRQHDIDPNATPGFSEAHRTEPRT